MSALDHIVRSGRALYVGISSYNSQAHPRSRAILKELGTPCLIHQPSYSMINRWVEDDGLLDTLEELGIGSIVFSPLAQGMLTDKYLKGIPQGSRATQGKSCKSDFLNERNIEPTFALERIADRRGQTLAQMAIAWVLRGGGVTSALIGASRPEQVDDCVGALANQDFTAEELAQIDVHAGDADINLWAHPPKGMARSASENAKPSVASQGTVPLIVNPILPGFNPDPSICRVGDDYFIATSTFEWYPGVQIHHSRDLVNWTLVSRPLTRATQLDMRGNPDSGGIWAPCLSYADGLFWLVYTDVKRIDGNFKDTHNYIITARRSTVRGPIRSSEFLAASIPRCSTMTTAAWTLRCCGTIADQASAAVPSTRPLLASCCRSTTRATGGLVGRAAQCLRRQQTRAWSKAPHLFKRDGWYYMTVAEGGTGYDHAVTMARSRKIGARTNCIRTST